MARIASGNRINRAADDPSGLVALNAVNSEMVGVQTALEGNRRTESMLNVADSTLTEVNSLISDIEGLALKAAGTDVSAAEKAAFQAQIDSNVDSIDRLIGSAEFNGRKLFGGEYRINAYSNSAASVKDLHVYSRNPNVTGNITLTVDVTAAARRASAVTTFATAAPLSAASTIQVTGKLGTAVIELKSGTTGLQLMAAIAAQKAVTGVSAAAAGANMAVMSTSTGSEAFVSVSVLDGSNALMMGANVNKTIGVDAVVTVNGERANARGTEVFYTGQGISLSLNLAKDAIKAHTVTITGGGATFRLGGDTSSRSTMSLGGMNGTELGRSDLGYLDELRSGGANALNVSGTKALEIAQQAGSMVATYAGRIGSFNKYAVGSSIRQLEAHEQALTATADQINGTDYAADSAKLERQNILMNAAISMISMANQQQANVLALLG